MQHQEEPQILLSVPTAVKNCSHYCLPYLPNNSYMDSDPPNEKLGSGGGTAHLLYSAWQATGKGLSFSVWLNSSKKLVIHGGGQSRRLPAYSAVGKPFIPLPAMRNEYAQKLNNTLLEAQLPDYFRLYASATPEYRLMITSGDVLLKFGDHLPKAPTGDILAYGMKVAQEEAERFGVFFTCIDSDEIDSFMQKPPADIITSVAPNGDFLVDTGIWLLSERAVLLLMELSGYELDDNKFINGKAHYYELYAGFGLALGKSPLNTNNEINKLKAHVLALPQPEFYHLGTSEELITSVAALQNRSNIHTATGFRHPQQIIQNSHFELTDRRERYRLLWIDNAYIPDTWKLTSDHIITNIPKNNWSINLESGTCLDFAPYKTNQYILRFYGINDTFSGCICDDDTRFINNPIKMWFANRNITLGEANISFDIDIQQAQLFPILSFDEICGEFINWLLGFRPSENSAFRKLWINSQRCSADEMRSVVNVERIFTSQADNCRKSLIKLHDRGEHSIFYQLDLQSAAKHFSFLTDHPQINNPSNPIAKAHEFMFHSALLKMRNSESADEMEKNAFQALRMAVMDLAKSKPSNPQRNVLRDQIVWARSPVRLDLAGGWTDTPPYCFEHGGKVVNIAVNLNGQPPVQVFARFSNKPEIVIRSIDLGSEQRITSYAEIEDFAIPGSEFGLAKAGLALAGFHPDFSGESYNSLHEQLMHLGGVELSLLSAVPAGSGLGTSSILAATILGALSELCGLGWDKHDLIKNTLAVEQMLTTGGGWQDQAGAIFGGIKLLETEPGLLQKLAVRFLPDTLFDAAYANRTALLYYTGFTRMAKHILEDIVRGMFLNASEKMNILAEMKRHALDTFDAIQLNDRDKFSHCIRRSWMLNNKLDSGTNTLDIQSLLNMIDDYLLGYKLLGAGGGGFLLLLAKDETAGMRIKSTLESKPPNDKARFVEMSVSRTGLSLTKS